MTKRELNYGLTPFLTPFLEEDLALCLQPVVHRMAGSLAPQFEQTVSASANKF